MFHEPGITQLSAHPSALAKCLLPVHPHLMCLSRASLLVTWASSQFFKNIILPESFDSCYFSIWNILAAPPLTSVLRTPPQRGLPSPSPIMQASLALTLSAMLISFSKLTQI